MKLTKDFGAHTYRRTCYCGDYTGSSILKSLLKKVNSLNIPIIDDQYVTQLLIKNNCCFGAISFNTISAEKRVFIADSVVLATGGHTRIWKRSSSRKDENNGDGIYLALEAGCKLIDMEMVQFHPTGMLLPEDKAGTLVTEAVRGEGGQLFNKKGERFMKKYDPIRMELSTRDRVAIACYTEIMKGNCTNNEGILLDISHRSKDYILEKLPQIYNQFLEFQNLDISKEAMEIAPTAHYSMGGIKVSPESHSTGIKGLFAAGEVAGGLHGANRLGGNSLAEIIVFGKKAGKASALYAKDLKNKIRSQEEVKEANKKIDYLIKKGTENPFILLNEIGEIMWEYCGVVREEKKLKIGLDKIKQLKEKFNNLEVKINNQNCDQLIAAFNLQSSIISSEATIISAIKRNESRGAHQRSDFKEIDKKQQFSYSIRLEKSNKLRIDKEDKFLLRDELQKIVLSSKEIYNYEGKLLEYYIFQNIY